MKIIKKLDKYGTKIVTIALTMVMLLGAVVMVDVVLKSARADDSTVIVDERLDPEWYAAAYPEVAAAVGTDPLALFRHYAEHGIYEGRIPYAGADPGAPINGYKEPAEEVAARAAARAIEEAKQAQAEAAERAQSIAAAQVGVGEYIYDYSAVHDLSDWTPEQMAMLAQKQLEFDASGLVRAGWTEDQVQEKLFSLKSVYPEGSYGSFCDEGAGKIGAALYGADNRWFLLDEQEMILCDKDGRRVMPIGYVKREIVQRVDGGNIRDVRVGDMLYTFGSGTGHVSIVLTRDEYGITVVESNLNSDKKFHWGRRISWNNLENGTSNRWGKFVHYTY